METNSSQDEERLSREHGMNEEDKSIRHVKNITDAITDNVINTPDDEILEEVKEDHGDSEYEANIMRDIINKAKIQVNKDKFAQAKQSLAAFKANQKTDSTDNDFSQGFDEEDFDELTMAARDGKDISEKDMDGVREDWEDLKKMTSWKEKGNNEKS